MDDEDEEGVDSDSSSSSSNEFIEPQQLHQQQQQPPSIVLDDSVTNDDDIALPSTLLHSSSSPTSVRAQALSRCSDQDTSGGNVFFGCIDSCSNSAIVSAVHNTITNADISRISITHDDDASPSSLTYFPSTSQSSPLCDQQPVPLTINRTIRRNRHRRIETTFTDIVRVDNRCIPNLKRPNAPISAYLMFCKEQRASLIDRRLTFTEITRRLGSQWSSLAIDKKQEYIDRSNADKERYKCELQAYGSSESSAPSQLYCTVCDRYFMTRSNRNQHLKSKAHRIAANYEISQQTTNPIESTIIQLSDRINDRELEIEFLVDYIRLQSERIDELSRKREQLIAADIDIQLQMENNRVECDRFDCERRHLLMFYESLKRC